MGFDGLVRVIVYKDQLLATCCNDNMSPITDGPGDAWRRVHKRKSQALKYAEPIQTGTISIIFSSYSSGNTCKTKRGDVSRVQVINPSHIPSMAGRDKRYARKRSST